jgi:hypothetical protein
MTTMTEVTFDQAATTGAGTVEAARGIMRRAIDVTWPDDAQACKALQGAVWPLADSLATYDKRRVGIIRPGGATGLRTGPAAFALALAKAAADVSRDADGVVRVIGEQCGQEAAEYVSNGGN